MLCADETSTEFRFKNYLRTHEFPWLSRHKIKGQVMFPAAGYVTVVVEAIASLLPDNDVRLLEITDLVIGKGLILPSEDEDRGVETLLSLKLVEDATHHVEMTFSFFSSDSLHHYTSHEKEQEVSTAMRENASGKIRAIRSLLSADSSLPPSYNGDEDSQMLQIEASSFYQSVAQLGYGYHGEFQGLTELRRKLNHATGTIKIPPPDKGAPLTIHPSTLDCAIQAVLLAYSYPGDGRLRALHVPTRIDRIDIDLTAIKESTSKHSSIRFNAFVAPNTSATEYDLGGDVEIKTADRGQTILQLQGLTAVPFPPPSAENDTSLFFEMTWGPETYSAETSWPSPADITISKPASSMAGDLTTLADRVAYYFLREISVHGKNSGTSKFSESQRSLLDFCKRQLATAAEDGGMNTYSVWNSDSKDDIIDVIQR